MGTAANCRWSIAQRFSENRLDTYDSIFEVGTWMHFVVTSEGTTMVLYKDGEYKNSQTGGWEPLTVTRYNSWIGRSNHLLDAYLNGTVAYLRIWHGVALSQSQVTALYTVRASPNPTYQPSPPPSLSLAPTLSIAPTPSPTSWTYGK